MNSNLHIYTCCRNCKRPRFLQRRSRAFYQTLAHPHGWTIPNHTRVWWPYLHSPHSPDKCAGLRDERFHSSAMDGRSSLLRLQLAHCQSDDSIAEVPPITGWEFCECDALRLHTVYQQRVEKLLENVLWRGSSSNLQCVTTMKDLGS